MQILGEGSMGVVKKVRKKDTGEVFAAKIVKTDD